MEKEQSTGTLEIIFGILGLLMVFIKLYDGLYSVFDWLFLVTGGVTAVINFTDLHKIKQAKNHKKNET